MTSLRRGLCLKGPTASLLKRTRGTCIRHESTIPANGSTWRWDTRHEAVADPGKGPCPSPESTALLPPTHTHFVRHEYSCVRSLWVGPDCALPKTWRGDDPLSLHPPKHNCRFQQCFQGRIERNSTHRRPDAQQTPTVPVTVRHRHRCSNQTPWKSPREPTLPVLLVLVALTSSEVPMTSSRSAAGRSRR